MFIREHAAEIELDLQMSLASEPDATPQQKAAAIEAWANFPRGPMPTLSDEDISRDSIYGEAH
jgi:hypothetical protein